MINKDLRKDSSAKQFRQSSKSTRAYVSNLISRESSLEDFDAKKILDQNPEVRDHPSLVLDLAYEEYCRKLAKGGNIEQHSFVKRFPEIEDSLLRTLQVHHYVEQERSKQKPEWPKPGDHFGSYRLTELIGKGSFAFVFVAEQLNVARRKVVLKITRNAFDEIEVLSRLDHPNIVPIFTVENSVDGFTAICMPLISRVTLLALLNELHGDGSPPELSGEFRCSVENCWRRHQQEPFVQQKDFFPNASLFVDAVIQVGVNIATALKYSHEKGVLHCDIKPTNILISPEGKSMLFDFNLSAKLNSKTGLISGTLPYMAPEQLQALADTNYDYEATKAVDLFSFGVTIYQLLTGSLPWTDINESMPQQEAARVLLQKQRRDKINFHNVKGLNASFKRIIESCLAFDPNDRPDTADEVATLLSNETKAFKRTQRRAIKTPFKAGFYSLLILVLFPITIIGFSCFSQMPERLVVDYIEQGKTAESRLNFGLAISQYELALKHAATNQKLRFQSLCHLAIANARHGKEKGSQQALSALKTEFGKSDNLVPKIELALICSRKYFSRILIGATGAIRDILSDRKDFSVDDRNNYWAAQYRFKLAQRNANFGQIAASFRKLTEAVPDHFEMNLNLFRIQRRQFSVEQPRRNIRYSMLLRCLKTRGDTPYVISLLLNKACHDINRKKADASSYLVLVDRFAACGGKRSLVESALWNIQIGNEREKILDGIKNHVFLDKDTDFFEIYGVANPLNSYVF